jgi:hypothetical protein
MATATAPLGIASEALPSTYRPAVVRDSSLHVSSVPRSPYYVQ